MTESARDRAWRYLLEHDDGYVAEGSSASLGRGVIDTERYPAGLVIDATGGWDDITKPEGDPMTDTLRDLLPPAVRRWVYAVLGVAVPTTTTLVAVLADGWQWTDLPLIVASVVVSAGFGLAASNTPRPAVRVKG